jgi:hypothetical protein
VFPCQDSYSYSPNVDGHAVGEDLVLHSPLPGHAPKRALRLDACRTQRHAQARPGAVPHPGRFCFVLWQYKHIEELTVEDVLRLECLLGDVHLGADITVVAYLLMSILLVNLYSPATA